VTQHIKELLERTNKKKSKLRKKPKPHIEEHDGRGRVAAPVGLRSARPGPRLPRCPPRPAPRGWARGGDDRGPPGVGAKWRHAALGEGK